MGALILALVSILLLVPSLSHSASWYVRPATGSYGDSDGTSYASAFDGLAAIKWGDGNVTAGDTLFICGTFHGEDFDVGASGTSVNPILIYSCTIANGASNDDPGIIWGAQLWPAESGWSEADENGTYNQSVTNVTANLVVDADGTVLYVCEGEADERACVVANDKSWYMDSSKIYYHPGADGLKALHFYHAGGPAIDVNEKSYITFKDITAYMHGDDSAPVVLYKYGTDTTPAVGIVFDNCTIGYGVAYCIRGGYACDDFTLKNSTLFDCASGFYHTNAQSDNYLIQNNEFYHTSNMDRRIGSNGSFTATNGDMCAIAVQGGITNLTIETNNIHDWQGEGIYLYRASTRSFDDTIIRRNKISLDSDAARYNTGIILGGDNEVGFADGFERVAIYSNIITDCGVGSAASYGTAIRTKVGIPTDTDNILRIYNNTMYNCYQGLYGLAAVAGENIGFDFKNNIILSPQTDGYFVNTENITSTTGMTFDNNIYNGTGSWKWDGGTARTAIADWRSDSNQDTGSLTSDPLLTGAGTYTEASHFVPFARSPAVNAGANLGSSYATDYAGRTQGSHGGEWDIGAYVCQSCTSTNTGNVGGTMR